MKRISILIAVTAVAACAKDPEAIAAVEVGSAAFLSMSCPQLAQQEIQAAQNLENLSAAQRQAAADDALGVFLIGLPLGSMSGNDQEAQIAIARGQVQAIDRAQLQRGC